MNITILDNRDVIINSSDNLGTQNENNASIINFSFPESLMNANKKIVFITDDGNYWDLITNNSYKITNAVSKYKNVSVYVWLVDEQNDIDFRSKIWNVSFNKNEEPDDIVPTEEEISGFDTMITQLNQGLEELDEEKIKLRREYEKVEEGLEDLDEALIQVNNVDIDASKSGNTSTITITNKEGVEKSVQIEDGTDYVITQEDYQAIANVVETDIAPLMPTKTSDLDNDSGFIDNTVNNLTNYYDKTTSDGKYALISESGYSLQLNINSSTYVMTLKLKNKNGTVLSTGTVDLPLETMVVNASYDSLTKEIVLTLQNGNTVRFSVADLVSGLQAEITSSNKLASDLVDDTNQTNKFVTTSEKTTWNAKYVKPSGGIPKTDLSSAVQTSLGKADSALQEHQDISGKEDKSNKVTSIDENSTDTQYPSAKLLYDELVEKQTEIDGLVAENTAMKKQFSTAHISTTSIQLTDSAEDLPIEHAKIKGATSQEQYEGRNLWGGINYTRTSQGVVFELKEDGTMTINGTATGSMTYSYDGGRVASNNIYITLPAGTYNYRIDNPNNDLQYHLYELPKDSTTLTLLSNSTSKTFTIEEAKQIGVRVGVPVEVTVNNYTAKIIIESGSTAHDWEPYVGGQPAPNPAYPQTIHRVTGECNEKVVNKNWFDNSISSQISAGIIEEIINTGKRLTNTMTQASYTYGIYTLMDLSNFVGKTIRVKANIQASGNNSGRFAIGISDSDGQNRTLKGNTTTSGTELSFVVPELIGTTTFLYLNLYANNGGNAQAQDYVDYTNIVVTIDNEDMTYIPHAEQNAPLSLGNIEAYEGDEIEIDFVQKAGYKKVAGARLVQNMAEYVFTGNEVFSKSNGTNNIMFYTEVLKNTIKAPATNSTVLKTYSNAFRGDYTAIDVHGQSVVGIAVTILKQVEIGLGVDSEITTITDFKTMLAQQSVKLVYPLATPVTTPITDPTLLAQLETLINMKTYKEVTNIDLTGEDLAPVLDCDYYQDMSTVKSDIASIKARLDLLEE